MRNKKEKRWFLINAKYRPPQKQELIKQTLAIPASNMFNDVILIPWYNWIKIDTNARARLNGAHAQRADDP